MRLALLTLTILLSSCSKDLTFFSQTEKSEIKLCLLGNTGTGSESEKKMVKKLEAEKCDSIHFLGDLTYRRGPGANLLVEFPAR